MFNNLSVSLDHGVSTETEPNSAQLNRQNCGHCKHWISHGCDRVVESMVPSRIFNGGILIRPRSPKISQIILVKQLDTNIKGRMRHLNFRRVFGQEGQIIVRAWPKSFWQKSANNHNLSLMTLSIRFYSFGTGCANQSGRHLLINIFILALWPTGTWTLIYFKATPHPGPKAVGLNGENVCKFNRLFVRHYGIIHYEPVMHWSHLCSCSLN